MTENEKEILYKAIEIIEKKQRELNKSFNLKARMLYQIMFTIKDNLNMVLEYTEEGMEKFEDEN